MSFKKSPAYKFIIKWVKYLTIFFFVSTIGVTLLYRFMPIPVTPLMVLRLFEQEEMRLKKDWVSIEAISPHLINAVVAAEDNRFLDHYGFDFEAIQKAQKYNERKKGKKVRGASTITQQTAKNVFLWPQRSYIRKGLEVYFTFLIETFWGKERILEVYLNVIEFGDGIYGAEAAAQYHFDKPARDLTRKQASLLAAVLPSPLKRNAGEPSDYVSRRASKIRTLMKKLPAVTFE